MLVSTSCDSWTARTLDRILKAHKWLIEYGARAEEVCFMLTFKLKCACEGDLLKPHLQSALQPLFGCSDGSACKAN